jgi:hypothetical protein
LSSTYDLGGKGKAPFMPTYSSILSRLLALASLGVNETISTLDYINTHKFKVKTKPKHYRIFRLEVKIFKQLLFFFLTQDRIFKKEINCLNYGFASLIVPLVGSPPSILELTLILLEKNEST